MIFDNKRIVRSFDLFDNQVHMKVFIDKVEVLQIVVNTDDFQFATPLCDCSLDVLADSSTILVKLVSFLGDC